MEPESSAQLLTITLGDSPEAWTDAGFNVAHGTVRIGRTTLVLTGDGGGFLSWAFDTDRPVELPGLPGCDAVSSPVATAHPNGIDGIDHVVVLAATADDGAALFTEAGFDRRGSRDTEFLGEAARQDFFWAGDVIIELIGPVQSSAASPEDRLALFGLALVSPDLDETVAQLGERIGAPKDAVQSGRRIATLRGRDLGISLPVAVMSPHVRN